MSAQSRPVATVEVSIAATSDPGMTYDQAKRWLAKIGGETIEGKEQVPPRRRGSVIVSVQSAKGHVVQRHWLFDDTLEGRERELAIRKAFVRACEELRVALA